MASVIAERMSAKVDGEFPLFALDRIRVDPERALASVAPIVAHGARHASDHLPLVATLSLPADSPG